MFVRSLIEETRMKTHIEWLSMVAFLCVFGGMVVASGCGESAPPPAPAIEEPVTEEYEAGEAAYQKQG